MRVLIFALLLSQPALALTTDTVTEQPQPVTEHHLPASVAAANTDAQTAAPSYRTAQAFSSTSWFDTIDLELSQDRDADGFFSRLYVRFDAHTVRERQDAYAVYSLINDYGQSWVVHTSSLFSLYGASRSDWFAIDMQLNAIPRDYYYLRIELRDAASGALLAEISGLDTATLDNLKLEQATSDVNAPVVIVEERSGGSVGFWGLLALSCLGLSRRLRVK